MTPEQKADSVSAQHLTKFKAALKEAHKLADLPRNLDYRAQRMVQIVDDLAALVAPVSPCKKGCGFCCHQATVISEWEAKQIAQFAKRKMNEVKDYEPGHSRREELIDRFWGQPCPFLDNGACGIYPVRPFSCRLYFSLADDNSQCDITGQPNEVVPYFNFQPMEFAVANLFLQSGCRKWADIREFFPG